MKRGALALGVVAIIMIAAGGASWFRDRPPPQVERLSCRDWRDTHGTHPGMAWVPTGTYAIGDDVYPEEGPRQTVHVGGFWIDRHEVTNDQFAAFVKATGYVTEAERAPDVKKHPDLGGAMREAGAMVFVMPAYVENVNDVSQWWKYLPGANWRHPAGPDSSIKGHGEFPVVEVTFADAMAYAKWAGRAIPTEAEWEWAARGADANAHPDREQPQDANTWHGLFPVIDTGSNGFMGLAPTGCFAPNRLGLYDMIGNAWEWTSSVFTPDHGSGTPYTPAPDAMPRSDVSEAEYTIKGGSFLCAPNYCMRYRAGAREPQEADLAASHLGFRTILRAPGP
jgi:sulfatase modifying factor 1